MSAVSSISSNAPDLYQVLQNTTTNTSASTSSAATPTAAATTEATTAAQGKHHHGHHGGGASKIESAVTSALQNAPEGADPNQVIKDAITQALQPNTTDQNDPNAPATTASPATGTASTSQSDFTKLLASFGVDSQQFEQDLQDSLPANSTSSPNFSTMLKSFPPGSLIDSTG